MRLSLAPQAPLGLARPRRYEIEAGSGVASGCGFDGYMIWTRTKCGASELNGVPPSADYQLCFGRDAGEWVPADPATRLKILQIGVQICARRKSVPRHRNTVATLPCRVRCCTFSSVVFTIWYIFQSPPHRTVQVPDADGV